MYFLFVLCVVLFLFSVERSINFTCRSDEIVETKNPLFRKSSSSNVKQGTKISGIHTIIQSPHLQLMQHNLHTLYSITFIQFLLYSTAFFLECITQSHSLFSC